MWVTDDARRGFLYFADLAGLCVFLRNLDEHTYATLFTETDPPLINIGTGEDVTIRELAETLSCVLAFDVALTFDPTKPNGTPRKLMDVIRLHTPPQGLSYWRIDR